MKNKREIRILLIVLGIIIFVLAFQLAYKPLAEGNEEKKAQKTQLQTQVNQLQILWDQKEEKQNEILAFEKNHKEILKDIPSYVSQEDQILFVQNLENADFEINAMSMGANIDSYKFNENFVNQAHAGQAMMNAQLTLSYKGTYDQLKNLCKQIQENGNKETLQSISMSFDGTGKIAGTLVINQYARTGDANETYQAPNIDGVTQGQKSVFGEVRSSTTDITTDEVTPNPDQPDLP